MTNIELISRRKKYDVLRSTTNDPGNQIRGLVRSRKMNGNEVGHRLSGHYPFSKVSARDSVGALSYHSRASHVENGNLQAEFGSECAETYDKIKKFGW